MVVASWFAGDVPCSRERCGKVEVDESPRREINIAQRRRSPLHIHTHTHLRKRAAHDTCTCTVTYTGQCAHTYITTIHTTLRGYVPLSAVSFYLLRTDVPPHRSLDSTPKDSLTLRRRVWRREMAGRGNGRARGGRTGRLKLRGERGERETEGWRGSVS